METQNQELCVYKTGSTILESVLVNGASPYTGKTAEEFMSEGFIVAPYEDIKQKIEDAENIEYKINKLKSITEQEWWGALECLPPADYTKYGDTTFFRIPEAETGSIYNYFFKHDGAYYRSAMRRDTALNILTIFLAKL